MAVVEEGRTVEALIERRGEGSLAGNIYKGKIDNVLRGMEAAFVDLGLPETGSCTWTTSSFPARIPSRAGGARSTRS